MTNLLAEPLLDGLSPGLILILGALLIPILPHLLRGVWMIVLPILAAVQLLGLPDAASGTIALYGIELTTLRVDPLSRIFGLIFLGATLLATIYSLHLRAGMQHVAGMIYAGSAVGAVFAGDLVTLFLFWEGTAIASVFLIWAMRTDSAIAAGQRYLVMQVGSGVLLLAGTMIHYGQTGSLAFDTFDPASTAGALIFIAFGIKAAFPLLHTWLPDAYARATPTGTVWLSAFTTKLAIYALARGFAGTEILIPIGLTMAIFPLFQAAVENDLRKVLAHTLNNQLGFMVVGIGVGTELALAGVAGHALSHVLYKSLMFMAIGAVLYRLGTARASDLGGLVRSMPWTAALCCIGAAAMSAPFFAAFVSKSLILSAVTKQGDLTAWLILVLAAAGTFYVSALKVPWFAFFGRDSGLRPAEAPVNMLVAMAMTAVLCIVLGCAPSLFYALLPYPVKYEVYTLSHVVTQVQLLAFTALIFALLLWTGRYPAPRPSSLPDVDWLWRGPLSSVAGATVRGMLSVWGALVDRGLAAGSVAARGLYRHHGQTGIFAKTRPTNTMAFWMAVLLVLFLVLSFF